MNKIPFGTITSASFLFLFLSFGIVCAQGGFKKKYYPYGSLSSECKDVIETADGSLILAGYTSDTVAGFQFTRLVIIGADNQGNFQWIKHYGNPDNLFTDQLLQPNLINYYDSSGFYM